jgi:hypothetical protein
MEAAIRLLNEMVTRGLLDSYAIGGAMASLFYAEPVVTFDLDVFVLLPTAHSDRTIVTLEPQIAFLREHGAVQEGEHIVIQGLPVQILPAYNALVTEATKQAVTRRVGQVETRVCRQEHLLAILVQTGRDKDRARIPLLLEGTPPNTHLLDEILERHGLRGRWDQWTKGSHV